MIKPNFSENQLQQLVNTEITMQLYSHQRRRYYPIIINLLEEFVKGWDTGYYFPWLLLPPHPEHRGCNFFIQYKLSNLIEGHRAKEWIYWKEPYFRFQIPYFTKKKNNNKYYYYDYNQFDHLKNLTNQGYYAYYVTNHVVYDCKLFWIAKNQHLLNEIPFLDISTIDEYHKKVTFTRNSSYFYLHSEFLEIRMLSWERIKSIIKESKGTLLSDDIKFMKEFIVGLEEKLYIFYKGGFREEIMKITERPMPEKMIAELLIILKYLKRYLNIHWFKSYTNIR